MYEDDNEYDLMSPLGIALEENNIVTKNPQNIKLQLNNNKKIFDKIIIPYNFKNNNYSIPDKEIEGYESKEFVLNTLYKYNLQDIFKFDSVYKPSFGEKILFYCPICLCILILSYILIILLIMFLFNPLLIYLSYKFLNMIFSLIKQLKNTIYERLKKKAINKQLEETNNTKYCIEHKIKWNLGVSGYWLEIVKIRKDSELQERNL